MESESFGEKKEWWGRERVRGAKSGTAEGSAAVVMCSSHSTFLHFFFLLSRVFGILCGIMYSNLTGVVYLFRSGGGRERK